MSTRRFDLIAFDWDGTLFDSTGLIARCIQEACRDLGVALLKHPVGLADPGSHAQKNPVTAAHFHLRPRAGCGPPGRSP